YEGYDNYYAPKIGAYWGTDKWLVYGGHNISGYDDGYCGVGYNFLKKMHIEIEYDNNQDTTSNSFMLSTNQPLTKALFLNGQISYITYTSKTWQDYTDLKLNGGIQWRVNPKFNISLNLYSIHTNVDYSITNYDKNTFEGLLGFWYQVNKPLTIWGNYALNYIYYQDQTVNATLKERYGGFSFGATYNLNKKYSIYSSYYTDLDTTIASLPVENSKTTIVGISYNFY
ncbi:MAG TPA: hypothetical protein DDW50_14685, partial [Firmicutes bacterium]|nr:hypothetical protein [Bacillota bacterium]